MKIPIRVVLSCGLLLGLLSCDPAPDIDHSRANYIRKDMLDGEWYFRVSIVDKNIATQTFFVGSECGLDRVKFKITENALQVLRAYERVGGTEPANAGARTLIAQFPIDKQFDRLRDYDPATGVQKNVFVENDYDSPWWKRRLISVDLSSNQVPDFQCNDLLRAQMIQSMAHPSGNSETDVWRTRVQPGYIESTIDAVVKPQQAACDAIDDRECNAVDVKIKLSFRQVPPSDYEPKPYPDSIAVSFDKLSGQPCLPGTDTCEPLRIYRGPTSTEKCDLAKHDPAKCMNLSIPIFERFGYFRTERYAFDREKDFTPANTQLLINRWNIWQKSKRPDGSPMPIAERIPKPIVFYTNVQFPDDLRSTADSIADEWNTAFLDMVAQAKGLGNDLKKVQARYGSLFEIRQNSCNIANVISYAQSHNLTSELIKYRTWPVQAGNLEEACAVLELASINNKVEPLFQWEQVGDLRYNIFAYTNKLELAGPLGYGPSSADPLTGEIINANANLYGASLDNYAEWSAEVVEQINGSRSPQLSSKIAQAQDPGKITRFESIVNDRQPFGQSLERVNTPMVKAKRTTRTNLDRRIDFFGRRNVCFFTEMMEPAVAELAQALKGKSKNEARAIIRQNVTRGVALHEIGHGLGLRHNFKGSYDALNYFPQFWDVDTHDHRMTSLTTRKSEIQYSSIMDYTQRFNSDFGGIGLYDRAAIRFGYADLVEVFDESDGSFVPGHWNQKTDLFNYQDLPYLYAGGAITDLLNARSSSNAPINIPSLNLPQLKANMYKRKSVPFQEFYHAHVMGLVGTNKAVRPLYDVPYKYCSDEHADGSDVTCALWDMGASPDEIIQNAAQLYESYYLFNNFRRDRIKMDTTAYMNHLYSRTYQPMLSAYKHMVELGSDSDMRIWPTTRDWSSAAFRGVNFFIQILQGVEPGNYCFDSTANLYRLMKAGDSCSTANLVKIGLDQGRYYNNQMSLNGDSQPNVIGQKYDKLLAMLALTDSGASVDDLKDPTSRHPSDIGYYQVFPNEMATLFANLMLGKVEMYSPQVEMVDGRPTLVYQTIVDLENMKVQSVTPKIEASQEPEIQHYAMLLPMTSYTDTVGNQLSYPDRSFIRVVDASASPSSQENLVIFVDPQDGTRYSAAPLDGDEVSPAYLLLQEAAKYYSVGLQNMSTGGVKTGLKPAAEKAVQDAEAAYKQNPTDANKDILAQKKKALEALSKKLDELIKKIDMMVKLGTIVGAKG